MFHSFNESCQISSMKWAHSYFILFTITQETCGSVLYPGFLNHIGVSWHMGQSRLIVSIHSSSSSPAAASSQDSVLSTERPRELLVLSSKTHFSPSCPALSPEVFYLHCPTTLSFTFPQVFLSIPLELLLFLAILHLYFPSISSSCWVSTCILDFTFWKQNLGRRNLSSIFYAICCVSPVFIQKQKLLSFFDYTPILSLGQ